MSVAVGAATPGAPARAVGRTQALLQAPILPLLLRLSWPNVLVMLAQASTGIIETWWVSRLGTDALAGMALVFPGIMLVQMLAGGALGGGISSAIARALGAGRRADADALVLHAVVINIALGVLCTIAMLGFGRPLYRALGGEGPSLDAAMTYSTVVFAGNILFWLMNAFASAIRGTGNMLVPALVTCGGVVLLVPLSPLLIFGVGPFPAMGIAGGGAALLLYYAGGTIFLGWYILSGRNLARLRLSPLRADLAIDILRIGAVAAVSSLQTNLTVGLTTALVGNSFGTVEVAGYGTGARLEYLLIPLAFGLGAPLVTLVGTNIGAGQFARARTIAFTGAAITAGLTELVGVVAACWPEAWLTLFGADPRMVAAGAAYLRAVGPFYGFFGLGLSLYFSCQGAGRLGWPLLAGTARMVIAVAGGWLALSWGGTLGWLFVALGAALMVYGLAILFAVIGGSWDGTIRRRPDGIAPIRPA